MSALSPSDAEATGPMPAIFESVVRQRCLNATYNRDKIVLAPHVVYTRHGELYVDAVTVARNGMLPREERMGSFKVAGLGGVRVTGRDFAISSLFEPEAERYDGCTLIAVQPVAAG